MGEILPLAKEQARDTCPEDENPERVHKVRQRLVAFDC